MREPCLAPDRDQHSALLLFRHKPLWKLNVLFLCLWQWQPVAMAAFNDVHSEQAAESQAHCKCPAGAQSQRLVRRHICVQVRWAGDRCTVCDSDVDYDQDQLVSCDMCGITVHQSCYGVQELPGEDDMWLCRACELKVTSTQ